MSAAWTPSSQARPSMENRIRYLLYLAAKNRRYTRLETSDNFQDNTVTITVTLVGPMRLTPEEVSGLKALESGVPIEDLLA